MLTSKVKSYEIVFEQNIIGNSAWEDKLSSQMMHTADEAYQMTLFLKEMLYIIKMKRRIYKRVLKMSSKIHFFKDIKPQILGKLIYYNKEYSALKPTCPVSTRKIHQSYFESQLKSSCQMRIQRKHIQRVFL